MGIFKNLKKTKNQQYLDYATEPKTGHWVSSIYIFHESKIGRPIWSIIWQYYRDRKRKSVAQIIRENPYRKLKISWAGPPPEGMSQETILTVDPEEYRDCVDFSQERRRTKLEIFPRGDLPMGGSPPGNRALPVGGSVNKEPEQWGTFGVRPNDQPGTEPYLLEWTKDLRDARTMSRQARLKGCTAVSDRIVDPAEVRTIFKQQLRADAVIFNKMPETVLDKILDFYFMT